MALLRGDFLSFMGLRCNTMMVQRIIVACAILHNICVDAGEDVPNLEELSVKKWVVKEKALTIVNFY